MQDISDISKDHELGAPACLERLQKAAVSCLEGFQIRVIDLNAIIEIYAPKSESANAETIRRLPGSRLISSTIGEYDLTSAPDFHGNHYAYLTNSCLSNDECMSLKEKNGKSPYDLGSLTSYCTLSTYQRGRSRHGICKRRYYKIQRSRATVSRRRPGALGQLLVLLARKVVSCTKNMLIAPSIYIVERIISALFQRRELKNVQCGSTCADWSNSPSACVTSLKEDNTTVGSFISVMRPAAVQLISDTTILKRWLQALATRSSCQSSVELNNATRNTETIDGWAYELFFHLKYLQVNRARDADKVTDGSGINDEVTHMNLWHRMVQLRDNYIILYEILYANPRISKMASSK